MILKQSEIHFVKFGPGQGHEYQKTRPAIILMTDKVLASANIITCVPLTSNCGNIIGNDIKITKDSSNNLMTDSIAKMHHITACDKSRILKYIGTLSESDKAKIDKAMKQIFGL